MRRRAAIDSSPQLCLWDELGRVAEEHEDGAARGAGEPPAADRRPPAERTAGGRELPGETTR